MLIFLRRYWPLILIAVVFSVAVHKEWLNKTTPQPPLNAAAPQIPALAASQPPAISQGAEAQAKASEKKSTQDQPGAEQTPPVVKLVAPKHDERETEKKATERHDQTVTEQDLANYTWYLVVATIALAFIALGQAGLFVWQLLDLRKATVAATTQAQIAQKTFEALERPYVFVFGLSGIASMPDEGLIPRVRYNVANYGKVAAIIDGVWIVISSVADGVPEIPVLVDLDNTLMTFPVIAPGEVRKRIAYDLPEGATGIHDNPQFMGAQQGLGLEPNLNLNEDLLAKIVIRYRGPFTMGHITSIAWGWDKLTKGFVVIADPAQTFNR